MRLVRTLLLFLVGLGLAFYLGTRYQPKSEDRWVASVGPLKIHEADLSRYLPVYRRQGLRALIQQKCIDLEFSRKQLKITPEEVVFPKGPWQKEEVYAVGLYAWHEAMLKKLVMAEWPESRQRKLFADSPEAWIEYQVALFPLSPEANLEQLESDRQNGVAFANLPALYGQPEQPEGGWQSRRCNREQLRQWLGVELARQLSGAAVNGWFASGEKPARLFNLSARLDKFEQIRPSMQASLWRDQRAATLEALLKKSKIQVSGELGGSLDSLGDYP